MVEPDLQRWLDEHALDLATSVPGEGTADLAPLGASLAGTRVLGVGEAVVGTRELGRLTHRLLELAVDAGARTLALGAPEAATVVIDEAVARGGDPGSALETVGEWRWNTREVAAVLGWLGGRNADRAPADRVRVVGLDPVSAAPSVKAVALHLRTADPDLVDTAGDSLHRLLTHRPEHAALPAAVAADAERVRERLDRDGVAPTMRRHAVAIDRAGRLAVVPEAERAETRARLVADALAAAVDETERAGGPDLVWWAHARDVRVRVDDGVPTVGARLRERFDRDYYGLGLLVGRGEFCARRRRRVLGVSRTPTRHPLAAPPPDSVEATVAGTGPRVLDLRGAAEATALPEWVTTATRMRVLGDPTPVGWKRALEAVVPGEFDGLAHVAHVHQAAVR